MITVNFARPCNRINLNCELNLCIARFDLSRLAVKLDIVRKYRWEEPMKFNPVTFARLPVTMKRAFLYCFGGVVLLNCSGNIIARILDSIPQSAESLKK